VNAFWIALLGAVVGGLFTLLGVLIQSRATRRAMVAQVELTAARAIEDREVELRRKAYSDTLTVVATAWADFNTPRFRRRVSPSPIRAICSSHRHMFDDISRQALQELIDHLDPPMTESPEAVRQTFLEAIRALSSPLDRDRLDL
jgi:hypothetical protein